MTGHDERTDLIRLPAATIGAMIRVLRAELGEEKAAATLRRIGLESGSAIYDRFREWLSESGAGRVDPEDLGPAVFWERLSHFFSHLGWGTISYEAVHPGVISLRFFDWVEARQDPSPTGCHFTTGIVAELLRRVAGGELAALEIQSDPAGTGSAHVLLGNASALDSLFETMRVGASFEEALAALV